MADAFMAIMPAVGSTAGVGPSASDQLEALKFAAYQDSAAFQDDPKFYTWLEDWIGKQDEESAMIDAFNTLTDYGMQFDFQQQQQQQQKVECDVEQPFPAATQLPVPPGTSSCASLASHPSSQPSSDDASLGGLASPSDSSAANSSGIAAAALSPNPFGALPAATRAACAGAPGPTKEIRGNGPFDAASFTQPLSRGLDAFALPPELSRLLGRPPPEGSTSSLSLLEPLSPGGGASLSLPADRIPSHGTVTSYAGTPPLPAQPPAIANPTAAAAATAAASDGPAAAAAGGGGSAAASGSSSRHNVGLLSVPSLEQLIARAICGNGTGGGTPAAGGGSLGSIGQALLVGAGAGAASTSGLGLGTCASAPSFFRNASSGSFGDGAGGTDCVMRNVEEDSPFGSGRFNSCSNQDLPTHNNDLPYSNHNNHNQPLRSMSGLSSGGPASGGGVTATARLLGSRRKSSTSASGAHTSSQHHHYHPHHHYHHPHHHHGIPVSHAHGHGHVGKAGAAYGAGVGGAAAHAGAAASARGSGGVSASGRPTRSARAKAVFTALEAEVAGKLGELEALQREHATLAQRVEILEVAVERQDAVLRLMQSSGGTSGIAGNKRSGGAGSAVALDPRSAAAAGGGGGMAAGGGGGASGSELLEWARSCNLETYTAWYKDHLQNMSLALLALEDSTPNPEAEARLVQLVTSGWSRTTLVCIFQPLIQLRLRGLNLETGCYSEPQEQHWLEVIKFMSVGPAQVAEMENLFHSYNLLHGSFRAELQDAQCELQQLVAAQEAAAAVGGAGMNHCSKPYMERVLQQTALLKRVRSVLQKTHLLYSSTIGVAALRIMKPKEFAKCQVQSYPYFPCGPSLMRACLQFRSMKAIWGPAAVGLECDCDL